MVDKASSAEKQIPVLKAQSTGINQYLNMFGFQKKDPTSPRSLAAIDAVNKLVDEGFQGVAPKGASGNPEGYRNQYIPFVENKANTLAPQTQEHLNKSRTKAQVKTVNDLIEAGVPLSQQGKASMGAMLNVAGNALGILGLGQEYKKAKKSGDWSDFGMGVANQLVSNVAPRLALPLALMTPGSTNAGEQEELARRRQMAPTISGGIAPPSFR
jgi:hypothetical protein